jgi:membrane protein implicated in regulation of membrane protease activity
MMGDIGKMLMALGGMVFVLGVVLTLVGRLSWFGRLPGDLVVERGPVTFYFPIVTCVILSVVLSLLLWLFRR